MGVKFKCLLTGNIFEFHNDFDVEDMREHPQYEEVEEELVEEPKVKKPRKTKEAK